MDNVSQKEIQKLKAMIEAKEDITACVALYLDLYEDTDVMHHDIVENEIEALRAGNEENNMEAGRLELMLRDNPGVTYFDYYNEKPITFKWLRDRLQMGADPKKTINLLRFLQNGNVVRIRNNDEFERFLSVMHRHGLLSLVPCGTLKTQTYIATVANLRRQRRDPLFPPQGEAMVKSGEWDGTTLYAECQIGKESIGIYPYTVRATVEWYGVEPMSVDDIDEEADR